jgi:hypothetical protein
VATPTARRSDDPVATVAPSRTTRKTPSTTPARLTAAEREIVLTLADNEDLWTVYTDSRRAASSRLLQAARQWGLIPQRVGACGWEVRLPLAAVRVVGPPSARRRAASQEALRKARSTLAEALRKGVAEGSEPSGVS